MAHPHGPSTRYPAGSTTTRGRRSSTPRQAAPPSANEPVSSESYLSSSPSLRTTSLLSDTPDLRTTTTSPHMNRLPSPSHEHSVRSVPGSAAISTHTPRRSPSSSIPRSHDMDHRHQQQQYHHGQSRSRPTTLQRVATGFRRLTRSSDVPVVSEEDWSVFGEAMAHEGVHAQTQAQSQLPPPPPSPPGVVHASHVLVSTPISDAHIEDFIPSVEGGAREVREGEQDEEEGRSSLGTGLLGSSSHSHSHVDSSDTESTSLVSPEDTDQQGQSLRGGKGKGRSSSWWKRLSRLPTLPTLYRNILKCSLAYFLGSLFTYYDPLSRFISELTQDGPGEKYPSAMGHMVATV
jgi:hypothetical protein